MIIKLWSLWCGAKKQKTKNKQGASVLARFSIFEEKIWRKPEQKVVDAVVKQAKGLSTDNSLNSVD